MIREGHDSKMNITKSFKTSDGLQISYEDLGQGRPIFFIHGWAATGQFWRNQLTQLSPRFRTVAVDLRGHGDSSKELDVDYSIERMSEDVAELIDLLALRDYMLVGHSMGGAIAARCAARHEGSAGLVFTGVSLRLEGDLSILSLEILMRFRGLAEKVVTPRMFGPHSDEALLDFVRKQSAKSPANVLLRVAEQIANTDLSADIKQLRIPSMVVTGEFDSVVPPAQQKEFAERLKARFVVLKDVGHNLMLEKPNEFGQLVGDFASSLAPIS